MLYISVYGRQPVSHKVVTVFDLSDGAGRRWIKQMFIGAFLIPAMVCGTAFFINFIAIYYHASRAIPFGTMVGLKSFKECRKYSV